MSISNKAVTKILTSALAIMCLNASIMSPDAHAYRIAKYVDPVTGHVTYGSAPKAPGIYPKGTEKLDLLPESQIKYNADGTPVAHDSAKDLHFSTEVQYDVDGRRVARKHLGK